VTPQAYEIERQEGRHRGALVHLHRMARDPVPEINAPRQVCFRSVGSVRQTGEQAAETADDDSNRKRADKHPAGRATNSFDRLVNLHRDDRADQGPDHAVRKHRRRPGPSIGGARDPRSDCRAWRQC